MPSDPSDRRFLKRSLGISAGLHILLLPLFLSAVPAFLGTDSSSAETPGSEATSVSYLRIDRRPPQPAKALARPPRRAVAASPIADVARAPIQPPRLPRSAPPRHIVRTRKAAASTVIAFIQRSRSPAAAGAVPVVRSRSDQAAQPGPMRAAAVPAPVPVVAATASPSPGPSATPAPAIADASTARGIEIPAGGWGQNFEKPIIADEAALADLKTRYHDVARASVAVDDTGHALSVTLPAGLPDDVRAELERRLMELRYVPAECNGLHCPGTLLLTL